LFIQTGMDNLLINLLFANCATLAKGLTSQSEAANGQDGAGTLSFLSLFSGKMGVGVASAQDLAGTATSKEANDTTTEGAGEKESAKDSSDTQGLFALLQSCMNVNDAQTAGLDTNRLINLESFLKNIFDLLGDGESVQLTTETTSATTPASQGSKSEQKSGTDEANGESLTPETIMNLATLVSYLASMMDQKAAPEASSQGENTVQVVRSTEKTGGNTGEADQATDKQAPPNSKTYIPIVSGKENSEVVQLSDASVKSLQKIEVKKIDGKQDMFQVVSYGRASTQDDEAKSNSPAPSGKEAAGSSPLAGKAEKVLITDSGESENAISKTADKGTADTTGKDQSQLMMQNDDYARMTQHTDKANSKTMEKTPFASLMTDKIEKIVEQYANKNSSMDMVVRLKVDDKETLLVGLKDQGQRVTVEVKTTSQGMGSFLQSQKEEITKQLEGKNIYANIYVDVNNEGYQKREQNRQQKDKGADEKAKQDFDVFLESAA